MKKFLGLRALSWIVCFSIATAGCKGGAPSVSESNSESASSRENIISSESISSNFWNSSEGYFSDSSSISSSTPDGSSFLDSSVLDSSVPDSSVEDGSSSDTEFIPPETVVRGLHEKAVSETNIDLVKDGKSDYVIVIGSEQQSEYVTFAVSELVNNFFEATGVCLEVKTDDEVSYTVDAKFLSVGQTDLLQQAGVTYDKNELGPDGYVVQTKDSSIFMAGSTDEATIFAVYGWLTEQFDYEYYSIGEIAIEQDLINEKLLNVTLKERPDFDYRLTTFGEAWFDLTVARRARATHSNESWVEFHGVQYHTSFNMVPPEVYKADHPEWYAASGEQLCYSRDPEGLAEVVIEEIKAGLIRFPDRNLINFAQQDHNSWCDCRSCLDALARYGTNSAVFILFVNRVTEAVSAWVEVEYPGRDFKIALSAYQKTEDAPVITNSDGTYSPADESLRLHKNAAVLYAPIYASYYYDFYSEENIKASTTMEKWKVLADTMLVWIYGTNFQLYLGPYNNFNSMQNNYRYLYDNGAEYIFDQQQFNQTSGTDWYKLRAYLTHELQWQIDQDQTVLINNFFDNYYKDASKVMKRLFDEENTWFAYLAEHHGYTGKIGYTYSTLLREEYWPQGLLEGWLELIDEAYKAIEPLRSSNPSLHETLTDRINLESLSFRFMLIGMYSIYYSENEVERMKKSFAADCLNLGVRSYSEQFEIGSYIN